MKKLLSLPRSSFSFSGTPAPPLPRPISNTNGTKSLASSPSATVHGAYDNLVAVLKNTGLVDDNLDWIGGEAHLVQVGDIPDRGAESRRCLDLLMELEKKAERAGGRVHALIGNHEAFNMVGIFDYTTPDEFRSYLDSESEKLWERAFETFHREATDEARAGDRPPPSMEEVREDFAEQYPPGYFGHRRAFRSDGRYGSWILDHKVADPTERNRLFPWRLERGSFVARN